MSKTRILHVDDEAGFGELVATFLEREGDNMEVISETSAEDGLETLERENIECIVSDYDMPRKDGLEFLAEVRDRDPAIPFILFTGKGNEEIASEAISAGVTDYMQKGSGTDQYAVLANRVQNVVRQYRSKQEAEQMQRRLTEVTESSTDCIWMFTRDWDELLYISGFEAVWGHSIEEINEIPQDFLELIHPADRDSVRKALDTMSSGRSVDIEYRVQEAENEARWVWMKGGPVFDDDGSVVRVVGFTRDITDRKARQRKLQKERDFIDQAINTLDEVFYVIGTDGTLQRWNDSLEAVTGYGDEKMGEMDIVDFFPADQRDRISDAIAEAFETGEVTVEAEFQTAAGKRIPHEFTGARLTDPDGSLVGLVGVGRDISDRKEREQDLQRKERRYQAILNDPNMLAGILDTDGTVLEQNQTGMEYIDATVEDIVGELFWETPWWPDELRSTIREKVEQAASGEYIGYEADLATPDGEPYSVSGVIRPVTNTDGEIVSLVVSARDITERTEREKRLERYERLVEHLPVGVFRTTIEGDFVSMNEALVEIFDAESRDQLRERGVQSIYASEADRQQLIDQVKREGIVEDELLEAETVAGRTRWVRTTLRLVEEDGERYLDGILRDVTDRRELVRRRERAETIFEHTQDGLFLIDVDDERTFRVQRVNRAYTELTGFSTADVRGKTPREILDGEQGADIEAQYRECLDRREPIEYEEHLAINGETQYWHTRLTPVFENDQVVQLVGATRDVTKQKVREKQLDAILENTTTPMFLKNRAGEYILPNRKFVDLFDLDEEAVIGKTDDDLFPDEMAAAVKRNDRAVLEQGEPIEVEERILVNGSEQVYLTSKVPLYDIGVESDPDDPVAVFGVANDISDRKQREQELARQNEQFDELASVVSHDLKTPIETVRGRLELAKRTDDPEQIDAALDALQRVDELRENIVSMVQSREIVEETERIGIAAAAESAWESVTVQGEASLEIVDGVEIEANSDAVGRLLQNLLSNSIEHGSADILIRVGETENGFYVEDNGPGIPAEHRDEVFTPGFTTKDGGNGMGMASVRQIVDAHGWQITITDSETLGGVRFEIVTDEE